MGEQKSCQKSDPSVVACSGLSVTQVPAGCRDGNSEHTLIHTQTVIVAISHVNMEKRPT